MMEDQLKSTLHISDECGRRIVSNYKLYRNISILVIIYCVWSFIKTYFSLDHNIDRNFSRPVVILEAKIYPIFYLLQMIMTVAQFLFYNKAFHAQKQAFELSDEQLFTDSYKLLRTGNYWSLAIVVGLLLYQLIFLYFDINKY